MKTWIECISRWRLDKKMQALVTFVIITMTCIVVIVSTIASVTSMKQKSIELLQTNNDTLAENFAADLEQYKALALGIVLDDAVQTYLQCDDKSKLEYSKYANDAVNIMTSCQNMYADMCFIAIVSYQMDDYLYKGMEPITTSNFQKIYIEDYKQSQRAGNSTLSVSFSNAYHKQDRYSFTVYFPIYDRSTIMMERGLLCMNFSTPLLNQILDMEPEMGRDTSVIQTDGTVVADYDRDTIGEKVLYHSMLHGESGSFSWEGKQYIYQKVQKWNYFIVSSIDNIELYAPSIHTNLIMTAVLLIMVGISFIIIKKVIQKVYEPLNETIYKMDEVAAGSLQTRLNEKTMGEDFRKLAIGFNSMMEEILVLMERVKKEQHQVEQIRFNVLQSQIQPHFLYNTLDCIHWQAIVDGNKDISTLVMALAKFYRICLSGGHDVIPLQLEVEHLSNYLIIQNMRYDNIIGSEIHMEDNCKNAMIPKLTLQPLVENSIYHGIKIKEGRKGSIHLKINREEKRVMIVLEDTGSGMSQMQIDSMNQQLSEYDESFGYGVRNVNKRIQLLYGKEYGLYYLQNQFGGVTVKINLPYTTETDNGILKEDRNNV